MSEPSDALLVITSMPDQAGATRLAEELVTCGLAACVNLLPAVTSIYRWDDELQHGHEVLMQIKTTRAAYAQLENKIQQQHPYELPEIIAVPVALGLRPYLDWIKNSTHAH